MNAHQSVVVHDASDFELRFPEIDQQTQAKLGCLQVVQALSQVNVIQLLNRFEFEKKDPFNQKVGCVLAYPMRSGKGLHERFGAVWRAPCYGPPSPRIIGAGQAGTGVHGTPYHRLACAKGGRIGRILPPFQTPSVYQAVALTSIGRLILREAGFLRLRGGGQAGL